MPRANRDAVARMALGVSNGQFHVQFASYFIIICLRIAF
jgi:hypothetical protein